MLADRAPESDADLRGELSPYAIDGHLTETVSLAYDLAHKPAAAAGRPATPRRTLPPSSGTP